MVLELFTNFTTSNVAKNKRGSEDLRKYILENESETHDFIDIPQIFQNNYDVKSVTNIQQQKEITTLVICNQFLFGC